MGFEAEGAPILFKAALSSFGRCRLRVPRHPAATRAKAAEFDRKSNDELALA